ncbi:hypothetical protein GCM10011318_02070 [Phaeocystidibacter marisrubri]|nr:hypothetical protein GCM10011318_02070 [Phaeocystidibacter marisrubri]
MRALFKYISLLLLVASCQDPLVLNIEQIPVETPMNAPIYVAGNFNGWNPGDPSFQVKRTPTGGGTVEIPRGIGHIEFKFTRGDWNSVEVDSCGKDIDNRFLADLDISQLNIRIQQWQDRAKVICDGIELYIRVPEETAFPNEIYLSGEFNNWELADDQYRAVHLGGQNYKITLPSRLAGSAYKINRGTWNTVEVSAKGEDIEERHLNKSGTQRILIQNWKDLCMQTHPYRYLCLVELPANTPEDAEFYMASSINGWNPADGVYRFERMENGTPILRIPIQSENIEFKITRGDDWKTVEVNRDGYEISNRILPFGIKDTIPIRVEGWNDL